MQRNLVRRASSWALLAGALVAASTALGQAPHPIPPPARPLHLRAAGAELIVCGRVSRVEPGRIAIATEAVLRGSTGPSFAVKRSPLRPPPLEPGERVLLFLRGARAPYVFAGDPSEGVRLTAPDDASWLAEGFARLLPAGDDSALLRAAYEWWAASPSPLLRRLAADELPAFAAREAPRK